MDFYINLTLYEEFSETVKSPIHEDFSYSSFSDGFGTDEFLKIIRYVIKGANVFVISHKTDLNDKFENVLTFDKVKGFSTMVSKEIAGE